MTKRHGMQGVFVFVLLGLFAVLSTLMVLLGAQMYHGTVAHAGRTSDTRILTSYVRSMIRGMDGEGGVLAGEEDGVPMLAFREEYDGEGYVTRIYPYEGALYELFEDEGQAFDPARGERICAVGTFEAALEDGLLTVRMTDEAGEPCAVRAALRCAR